MSWGPGSPWTGWVSLWAGERPGGVGGREAWQKATSLPQAEEVSRAVPGRKAWRSAWGVPAASAPCISSEDTREDPSIQPDWPFYLLKY